MKRILTILLAYIPAAAVAASVLLVVLLKWVPVTYTPIMLKRSIQLMGDEYHKVKYKWTPLKDISDEMINAVIAAEDCRFLAHNGFDYGEMQKMRKQHLYNGSPVRGCSTISQQTAKNCFTLSTRTWARKAVEAYYTVLIEHIWGKKRIMEVYLNVVEFGPGNVLTGLARRTLPELKLVNINSSETLAAAEF